MIKTNIELAAAAEKTAKLFRTLYVRGCFGAPMNDSNKKRYTNNLAYNKQDARKNKILAASADTFGFDCVCFIKGLFWDWVGDPSKEYGGAKYQSNGVPDIGANSMIKVCKDVSTDFSNIQVGEAVWIEGHIGLYIGNGLAAECTHRWADGVQITRVHNLVTDDGTPGRRWTKHGKLPYVEYVEEKPVQPEQPADPKVDFTLGMRNLRKGDEGEDVRALQLLLIANGYNCGGTKADGKFGNNTKQAVIDYQTEHGLVGDGVAGKKTMTKILGVRT